LMYYALGDPALLENLLARDGVNVALLSFRRSGGLLRVFEQMPHWRLLYHDDRNMIFFRTDAPENAHLFSQPVEQLRYPDEYSRSYTLGYLNLRSTDRKRVVQGIEELMGLEGYDIRANEYIRSRGKQLQLYEKLWDYFRRQHEKYRKLVEAEADFGRLRNIQAAQHTALVLADLARQRQKQAELARDKGAAGRFGALALQYNATAKRYKDRLMTMRPGWGGLW